MSDIPMMLQEAGGYEMACMYDSRCRDERVVRGSFSMARWYRKVARTLARLSLISFPAVHISLQCSRMVDDYA